MVKKMAIFVEGQTEQQFVRKLIEEIAGENNVKIDMVRASKSPKGYRSFTRVSGKSLDDGQQYYALIYDCMGDHNISSDIRDAYDGLVKADYSFIAGLRDVYPTKRGDIGKLAISIKKFMKTKPINPEIILAIMEIETWFLAEHGHFQKLDSSLNSHRICEALGFDPVSEDMQEREHPADDLDRAYRLVGLRYDKKLGTIQRTVNLLDYHSLYLALPNKLPALETLVGCIEKFLS